MGTRDQFAFGARRKDGNSFPLAGGSDFFVAGAMLENRPISLSFQSLKPGGTRRAKEGSRRTAQSTLPASNENKKQKDIMKKILSIVAGLVLTSGLTLAQTGPGSGTSSNYYNFDHSWSTYVNQSNDYNYLWGTNCLTLTNTPKAWSNYYQHTFTGPANAGNQVKNRFGKTELPADVQTIVQQFQQDRTKLMSQLKACSDEQRQQILKDMDQLRTQLRDQISKLRDDARQQADQMRNRFGNNRDQILNQGAGGGGTGRDR